MLLAVLSVACAKVKGEYSVYCKHLNQSTHMSPIDWCFLDTNSFASYECVCASVNRPSDFSAAPIKPSNKRLLYIRLA